MRALQFESFGGPISVNEVAIPAPLPHGVVITVMATGLCRSDWHAWQGHDPDITAFPHTLGHEFAGVVSEVGAEVTGLSVGDRVTVPFVCGCGDCESCLTGNAQVCPNQWQPGFSGPGSYAEYVAIPHADFNAVVLPDDVSFDVAASLGCRFATSYRAMVDVASVVEDDVVAIFGCGGIGLAAVMIAASRSARIIAIDVNDSALAIASRAGAAHVVNASQTDAVDAIRAVVPNGVDVSVDALGSVVTADAAVRALRLQGRHVQIGLLLPDAIGDRATVPMHLVIGRELQILGSHGMPARRYPAMLAEIAAGKLDPAQFITRGISLDDVPDALAAMSRETEPGVTIIYPSR
jgi:alcohol dehydrogenase